MRGATSFVSRNGIHTRPEENLVTATDRDIWALARLQTDHPLAGNTSGGTGFFGELITTLGSIPADNRQDAFRDAIRDRPDADDLIERVLACDPASLEPEPDEDSGWGSIRPTGLPAVEPFPLDVLPPIVQEFVTTAARSISCPVDYAAVATLAAASGAIGRSVVLRVKQGYLTSASLYLALVGGSSSGKSPALGAALSPLWRISHGLFTEWKEARNTWRAADEATRGDEPVLMRCVTSDPTTEALGPILAANPRGLLVAPDEMTKWIMSMDQYKGGKGGDRPFYLSVWSGAPVLIDRAKHMREPIVITDPYLTVAGGMTPSMLGSLSEGRGRDDGFLARLLFAFPDRMTRTYSDAGLPDDLTSAWKELIGRLWLIPMAERDGRPAPTVLDMADSARAIWTPWVQAHYDEQTADDFPEHLDGSWGKLEAYAARLALILHLLHLASDPTSHLDLAPISRRTLEMALRLTSYFKSQTRRVHVAIGGKADEGGATVRAIRKWIERHGHVSFSHRDLTRSFPRVDESDLAEALIWMAAKNMLRQQPAPKKTGPGRRPSPIYEVHPRFMDGAAKLSESTK